MEKITRTNDSYRLYNILADFLSWSGRVEKLEACRLAGIGRNRATNETETVCNNYRGSRERREKRNGEGRMEGQREKGQRGRCARTEKERRAEKRGELRGTMKSLTGRSEHNAPWSTLSASTTDPPHNPTHIVRPINIVLYRESWDEPARWFDRSMLLSFSCSCGCSRCLSSSSCYLEILSYSLDFLSRSNTPLSPSIRSYFRTPRLLEASQSKHHRFVSVRSVPAVRKRVSLCSCSTSFYSPTLPIISFLDFAVSYRTTPPRFILRLIDTLLMPRLPVWNCRLHCCVIVRGRERYPGRARREFHKNRRFRSILVARGPDGGGWRANGKYRKRSDDSFPIGRLVARATQNLFNESVLRSRTKAKEDATDTLTRPDRSSLRSGCIFIVVVCSRAEIVIPVTRRRARVAHNAHPFSLRSATRRIRFVRSRTRWFRIILPF